MHHVPIKATPGEKYGELLDWWTEAQYVVPRGATFEVVDFIPENHFMQGEQQVQTMETARHSQ